MQSGHLRETSQELQELTDATAASVNRKELGARLFAHFFEVAHYLHTGTLFAHFHTESCMCTHVHTSTLVQVHTKGSTLVTHFYICTMKVLQCSLSIFGLGI